MASRRVDPSKPEPKRRAPARTPEEQENMMIDLAVKMAEKQFRDGTASSQVTVHYLKLGSSREKLEQKKLEIERELSEKKMEAMESAQRVESLMEEALSAMRSYKGGGEPDGQFDD